MHNSYSEEAILEELLAGTPISLELVLLALSGLQKAEEIQSYQGKLDDIFTRFRHKCARTGLLDHAEPPLYLHRSVARCLFDYLWNSKPKRYGKAFLLTEVIDAQLNPDVNHLVGSCIGLASLFSVLGLRVGLHLSVLMDSEHLLSQLRVGAQTIAIDHTDPLGFDCRNDGRFLEFPLQALPASVFNSRGLHHERGGRFSAAMADYDKAVRVNPHYANAYNNRGNMRSREEDFEAAIADYDEAIRLNPGFCEAYCNRGMAQQRLGRHDAARLDYDTAMKLNSAYPDAQRCLQLLNRHESP